MSKKQIKKTSVKKKQISSPPTQSEGGISATNELQSSTTTSNQGKESSPSESVNANKGEVTFYGRVYKLSKTGRVYLMK